MVGVVNNAFKRLLQERVNQIPKRDDIQENYNCSKCRDLLYIFNELGRAVPCECKDKVESIEKLKKSGLEEAFKNKTIDNFQVTNKKQMEAKEIAMEYCKNFKQTNASLIITGRPGAGKTHLATGVMLNLIGQNVGCKYELYTSMLMSLKQSAMDYENHNREKAKYFNPRVLFLDDFLKGKPTDADLKYIFELVNERYLKKKPFIISTEMSMKQIISWDEAVGSRLQEMAQGYIVEFGTMVENYRLK